MSNWVPLDERELLEDDAYQGNTSPQEQGPNRGFEDTDAPSASASAPAAPAGPVVPRREVTRDMILKALEKQGARRRAAAFRFDDDAAEDRFLAQQSHVHLNGLGINKIANLRCLSTLEVLYLYDNQISIIENIAHLKRLTHLYLANNCIREISGLAGMSNLQKLYIEHNNLQVVSGLEACPSLEELHISNQRLPPGVSLSFHPATIAALAASLRILTASHCGITSTSLPQLAGLYRLKRLDLSHNAIDAFEPLDTVIQPCGVLTNLDLRGAPLCKLPKYRDTVILMNDSITTLDDEQIPAQHREFLLRLHIRRMKAQLAAELKEDQGAAAGPQAAAGGGGPAQGYGDPYSGAAAGGFVASGGVSGAGRVPPRTGGFHPTNPGSAPGSGAVSRNASSRGSAGGSRGAGAQGLARGMDGLSLHR